MDETWPLLLPGFPDDSLVKNPPADAGDSGNAISISGLGRSPGVGNGYNTPVFLPEKSHGQRSLVGYSPRGWKESDVIKQLSAQAHAFCTKPLLSPAICGIFPRALTLLGSPGALAGPSWCLLREHSSVAPLWWLGIGVSGWSKLEDSSHALRTNSSVGRESTCWLISGLETRALVPHMGTRVTVARAPGRDHGLHTLQGRVPTCMVGLSYVCLYNEIIIIADTSQCLSGVWCFINYG